MIEAKAIAVLISEEARVMVFTLILPTTQTPNARFKYPKTLRISG